MRLAGRGIACSLMLVAWAFLARAQVAAAADPASLIPSDNMLLRFRMAQYALVAGRIEATSATVSSGSMPPVTTPEGRRERYALNLDHRVVNLEYELITPQGQLKIVIVDSARVAIDRSTADGRSLVQFRQEASGPLSLVVEDGDLKHALAAPSFWHLFLASPALLKTHLIPLLEWLNPAWQLADLSSQVERLLLERAASSEPWSRKRWEAWVDDLASPNFADRQAAERELVRAGETVIPYLMSLDRRQLDAEQVYRARKILEAIAADYHDTPDAVVNWLGSDPRVWLALLERREVDTRRLAAKQLAAVLEADIEFDPDADEATRREQVERLRSKWIKPARRS